MFNPPHYCGDNRSFCRIQKCVAVSRVAVSRVAVSRVAVSRVADAGECVAVSRVADAGVIALLHACDPESDNMITTQFNNG